jgi:hypothetical protein
VSVAKPPVARADLGEGISILRVHGDVEPAPAVDVVDIADLIVAESIVVAVAGRPTARTVPWSARGCCSAADILKNDAMEVISLVLRQNRAQGIFLPA